MAEHNHATTSNTDEVFKTFIGCEVKGLLQDGDVAILVFKCGWGLAFHSNGSHWTECPTEMQRLLSNAKSQLEDTQKELEHLLKLAGE